MKSTIDYLRVASMNNVMWSIQWKLKILIFVLFWLNTAAFIMARPVFFGAQYKATQTGRKSHHRWISEHLCCCSKFSWWRWWGVLQALPIRYTWRRVRTCTSKRVLCDRMAFIVFRIQTWSVDSLKSQEKDLMKRNTYSLLRKHFRTLRTF